MIKKERTNISHKSLTDIEPDIPISQTPETDLAADTALPLGTTKKKDTRQPIRRNIMVWLILRDACSVSEITENCGLDEKGKNKYSYIWRQMKYLKEKGYIEKNIHFSPNDPCKGQGPCYSIKKDLRVLSAIYYDKEFEPLFLFYLFCLGLYYLLQHQRKNLLIVPFNYIFLKISTAFNCIFQII